MNLGAKNGAYDKETVNATVELARATSAENAARVSGVSASAVRNWMRAAGVKPRRRGNYSMAEAGAMGSRLRLP